MAKPPSPLSSSQFDEPISNPKPPEAEKVEPEPPKAITVEEIKKEDPSSKKEVPEKEAKVQPLELPFSEPLKPNVADEPSEPKGPPPEKAEYLGASSSRAADHGPKDKPKGDPYLEKGESREIRYVGRAGEKPTSSEKPDPKKGLVKKEGLPPLPKKKREKTKPKKSTPAKSSRRSNPSLTRA